MDCESCGRHRPSDQIVATRSATGAVIMACGRCRRHVTMGLLPSPLELDRYRWLRDAAEAARSGAGRLTTRDGQSAHGLITRRKFPPSRLTRMTASSIQIDPPPLALSREVSPTRLLASALLHVLDRDEPPPARWQAEPFVHAVATHRRALAEVRTSAELDRVAAAGIDHTFRGAVAALATDPLAAALAVRRVELNRAAALPGWPVIARRGVGPRVSHADASRWFG
jgi:hypothetical protein